MASYLTPEWLMSDLNQLMAPVYKPVSFDEFAYGGYHEAEGGQGRENVYNLYKQAVEEGRITPSEKRAYEESTHEQLGNWLQAKVDDPTLEGMYLHQPSIFDKESVVGGLSDFYDTTARPEAFTSFMPGMFKKLRTEHYQPEIEEGRGTLLSRLSEKQRLSSAKGGALAGYGGREQASQIGQQQYYSGMEDIYSGIEKQKAQGLQDLYDVMSQYETIGSEIG